MEAATFFVLLMVLCINAQFIPKIPCTGDDTCANIISPGQIVRCISRNCMCRNNTSQVFESCPFKDIILTAKHRELDINRDCSADQDCEHIEGAKCYNDQNDNSKKICDCQPHMVKSASELKCLVVVTELLGSCSESIQCTAGLDGAECSEGRCRCRPNFHIASLKKRCVRDKLFGEPCTREEESCYQISEPRGVNALGCSTRNVCRCLKNYALIDGKCQYSDASTAVFHFFILVMTLFSILLF